MTTAFDEAMQDGGVAWREGRLVDAEASFREALRRQPASWPAEFQLAWLDAAFGQLTPAKAQALDRPDLGAEARLRFRALIAQATTESHLGGALPDWDIGALDSTGADKDHVWWLDRGKRAWSVGLFGLANECYERAASRSNLLYDDPPSWAQGALTQADHHLAAVSGAIP